MEEDNVVVSFCIIIIIAIFMLSIRQDMSRLKTWAQFWIRRRRSHKYDMSFRNQKLYIRTSFDDCGGILLFFVSPTFLHYFMNENLYNLVLMFLRNTLTSVTSMIIG